VLLGSASAKAACKMLVKLTGGVNFINIYPRIFRTKFWCQSRNITRKAAKKDVRTKKAPVKTLMKSAGGRGVKLALLFSLGQRNSTFPTLAPLILQNDRRFLSVWG